MISLTQMTASGFSWLNSSFCFDMTRVLVHFAWQGTAVAIALMASNAVMARASAQSRYLAAVVALAVLLLCPFVTYGLLPKSSPAPAGFVFEIGAENVALLAETHVLLSVERTDHPFARFEARPDNSKAKFWQILQPGWLRKLSPFVAMTYMAGVFAMLIRLGIAYRSGNRLRSISTQINEGPIYETVCRLCEQWSTRIVPMVGICQRVTVPVIVGVIRPMILLPPSLMTGLNCQQLEALLAHEIAHIRRWDLAVNLVQRIVESFLFMHPAVWYISHRISVERENACDDLVLRSGWQATDYVGALLSMAEVCAKSNSRQLNRNSMLAAAGDNPSQLKQRVMRMLGQSSNSSTRVVHFAVLIPLVILLGSISIAVTLSANQEVSGQIQIDGQFEIAVDPKNDPPSNPSNGDAVLTVGENKNDQDADVIGEIGYVSDRDFREESQQTSKSIPIRPPVSEQSVADYRLIYFRHDRSPLCQQTDALIKKIDIFPVEVIDLEKDPEKSRQYGVDAAPCTIIMHDGNETTRRLANESEKQLRDLSIASDNGRIVTIYAIADLLIQVPSGLPDEKPWAPQKVKMASWLSMIDMITNSIEPKCWTMNGGECKIEPFETNLSLVVRAPHRIHEQVQELLAQMRRNMDNQVTLENVLLQDPEKDFLKKNGFTRKFDPTAKCVHLTFDEAKKLKEHMLPRIQTRCLFSPKVTMFDNQVGQLSFHRESDLNLDTDLCLVFRPKMMADQRHVRFNLAMNPQNVVSELIESPEFIEDGNYVLYDINERLKLKNRDPISPYQTYLLVCPRIIVVQEETEKESAK